MLNAEDTKRLELLLQNYRLGGEWVKGEYDEKLEFTVRVLMAAERKD